MKLKSQPTCFQLFHSFLTLKAVRLDKQLASTLKSLRDILSTLPFTPRSQLSLSVFVMATEQQEHIVSLTNILTCQESFIT